MRSESSRRLKSSAGWRCACASLFTGGGGGGEAAGRAGAGVLERAKRREDNNNLASLLPGTVLLYVCDVLVLELFRESPKIASFIIRPVFDTQTKRPFT